MGCDHVGGLLQSTHHTRGGAVIGVMADCCANCVKTPAPSNGGPSTFLDKLVIRTCWMDDTAPHKSD